MPEVGEIRAHAERLTELAVGKELERFRPMTFHVLKTFDPAPETAHKTKLRSIETRGKYLALHFEGATFLVHLMQGGRLKPDEKQSAKPRNGQARWTFTDGTALLLTEAGHDKRAGVWVFPPETDLNTTEALEYLGPEADDVDEETLAALLADNSMRLHGWLRRQSIIAGIGRRLANDICHEAQLSPFASTKKLDAEAISALHAAIQTCIDSSLAFERDQSEIVASAKRPSAVHNKKGEPCPRCGDTIREVTYTKYQVNYCATCQTDGKVLADNTTSKFLK